MAQGVLLLLEASKWVLGAKEQLLRTKVIYLWIVLSIPSLKCAKVLVLRARDEGLVRMCISIRTLFLFVERLGNREAEYYRISRH